MYINLLKPVGKVLFCTVPSFHPGKAGGYAACPLYKMPPLIHLLHIVDFVLEMGLD